jgi:hypothetical protein
MLTCLFLFYIFVMVYYVSNILLTGQDGIYNYYPCPVFVVYWKPMRKITLNTQNGPIQRATREAINSLANLPFFLFIHLIIFYLLREYSKSILYFFGCQLRISIKINYGKGVLFFHLKYLKYRKSMIKLNDVTEDLHATKIRISSFFLFHTNTTHPSTVLSAVKVPDALERIICLNKHEETMK